jgi:hypothetical protein
MGYEDAIAEVKAVREADEKEELQKSIKHYNAVINYGNPLVEHERVHLTLWVTLKTGQVVEVVGNFEPMSIHW